MQATAKQAVLELLTSSFPPFDAADPAPANPARRPVTVAKVGEGTTDVYHYCAKFVRVIFTPNGKNKGAKMACFFPDPFDPIKCGLMAAGGEVDVVLLDGHFVFFLGLQRGVVAGVVQRFPQVQVKVHRRGDIVHQSKESAVEIAFAADDAPDLAPYGVVSGPRIKWVEEGAAVEKAAAPSRAKKEQGKKFDSMAAGMAVVKSILDQAPDDAATSAALRVLNSYVKDLGVRTLTRNSKKPAAGSAYEILLA